MRIIKVLAYINANFSKLLTSALALIGKGFFSGYNCRESRLSPAVNYSVLFGNKHLRVSNPDKTGTGPFWNRKGRFLLYPVLADNAGNK